MERIKEVFKKFNISCFINYYKTFDQYKDSKSNKEIVQVFRENNETWTDKACDSRASTGKKIFQEGLQIDALRYIINSANENKISPEIKEKAIAIYSSIQKIEFDTDFFDKDKEPFTIDKLMLDVELKMFHKQWTVSNEEKEALVKIRLGQSFFRNELINIWGACAVTGCSNTNVLLASHIKAYKDCDSQEKYDIYNGLLLSPCYDRLFDLHLISFDDDGNILISKDLSEADLQSLKISKTDKLKKVYSQNRHYLKFHRAVFFNKDNNE